MNSTEDNTDGTVTVATSNVEDGQTVTVVLNSVNYTGSVSTNSVAITIPAAALQALTEGSHSVTANVSDLAGNVATEVTASFTYDKTAPVISSVTLSWGDYFQQSIYVIWNVGTIFNPVMDNINITNQYPINDPIFSVGLEAPALISSVK